jgi:hypothetical protein
MHIISRKVKEPIMWSDLFSALKKFDFEQANKILGSIDVIAALKNPWVIVSMVIICVILAVRRGENAVITFLSIPAILLVFQKTIRGMDVMQLEYHSQGLLLFIGGFLVIAGINLYFYFVR